MSVWETYSKRKKRLSKAGRPDIYQYDDIPSAFRVQVVHILRDSIGPTYNNRGNVSPSKEVWELVQKVMCRETGVFRLTKNASTAEEDCIAYILSADTDGTLDIVELAFCCVDRVVRAKDHYAKQDMTLKQDEDDAIEELNQRFREHGVGYQYTQGVLIRLDSEFAHAEIVLPTLQLLHAAGFDGPSDEFIRAFEHYRHGRHKEAVTEALKSFESTMKAICVARKWAHPPTATARDLIRILFENQIIPPELESHFTGLRSAMESGLPTIRNRNSGHGQGAVPVVMPPHFASYALHLAASNMLFLLQAHESRK
jgi:hypothetical protein